MSMNPASVRPELISPASDLHPQAPVPKTASPTQPSIGPDSEMVPERKLEPAKDEKDSAPRAQDAVQVQRETGNQIVIRYLDRCGQVIVQVPSSQALELEKAIEQALEAQQVSQAESHKQANCPGGSNNGY